MHLLDCASSATERAVPKNHSGAMSWRMTDKPNAVSYATAGGWPASAGHIDTMTRVRYCSTNAPPECRTLRAALARADISLGKYSGRMAKLSTLPAYHCWA